MKVAVHYDENEGRIVTAFPPEEIPMNVKIAGIEFDNVSYDADGDVLYLHVGNPRTAVDFDE